MDKTSYTIRIQQWAEIINAANDSGLTRKEWCDQNNISLRIFYYWHKKVRDHIINQQTDQNLPVPVSSGLPLSAQGASPVFCEIKKTSVPDQCTDRSFPAESFIPEAMLKLGQYGLYINSNISEGTLSTILSVLRNA